MAPIGGGAAANLLFLLLPPPWKLSPGAGKNRRVQTETCSGGEEGEWARGLPSATHWVGGGEREWREIRGGLDEGGGEAEAGHKGERTEDSGRGRKAERGVDPAPQSFLFSVFAFPLCFSVEGPAIVCPGGMSAGEEETEREGIKQGRSQKTEEKRRRTGDRRDETKDSRQKQGDRARRTDERG